jgi:hypothetical protein
MEDGGFPDDFARAAWEALTQNPEEPFISFETVEEREVLRYATADRMRPECVDCHNTRPDSPKTDWKVGDVRGVLEVITPLDAPIAATRSGLMDTAVFMLIMAAIGLLILGMVMSDLQEATHQTAALTEETRRAHEQERVAAERSEHLAREKPTISSRSCSRNSPSLGERPIPNRVRASAWPSADGSQERWEVTSR